MRFDIEVRPFYDETFSSWFFRTAIANGTDPKSLAIAIWKQNSLWYRDLDKYIPHDLIIQLSSQTMLSYQQIEDLTLSPIIKMLAPDSLANKYKWGLLLPLGQKGSIRTNGLSFCPKCLSKETPYIKKEWKMAWCVSCPTHDVQLITNCEKCGHIFSPHTLSFEQTEIYRCANCDYDLRNSKLKQANKNATKLQSRLSKLAFKNKKQISFPLHFKNKQDLFLSLNIFISFIAHIYNKDKYRAILEELHIDTIHKFTKSNNSTFCRYNIIDRGYLLSYAYEIFQYDTETLISLLQKYNVSKKILRRTYKTVSPTITYILSKLDESKIRKPPRTVKKTITPKSKKEVEALFDKIRTAL